MATPLATGRGERASDAERVTSARPEGRVQAEAPWSALEELRVADEKIRRQSDELEVARLAAEAEHRRYEALFQLAPDPYLVTDLAGSIRQANFAASRLLDVSLEALVSKPLACFVDPERRKDFRRALREAGMGLGTREPRRLVPRLGAAVEVRPSVAVERDRHARPVRILWMFRDVTLEREAQRLLRESHDALEERIAIRTAEVEDARRVAEDRLAAERLARAGAEAAVARADRLARELERQISERTRDFELVDEQLAAFTRSLAHNLRAPLRALHGFAEVLVDEHAAQLAPEASSHLRRIEEEARRMDRLINDLLGYSHLSRTPLERVPVDLAEAVQVAVRDEEAAIRACAAEVVQCVEPGHRVIGHATVLPQAIARLVSNALRYVDNGVRPRVRIRSEKCEDRVRLLVEDNGIGIASRHQSRVFDIFERLSGPPDARATGMGLAFVKRAVESLGGAVGVRSDPGQGSCFWIELPLAEP